MSTAPSTRPIDVSVTRLVDAPAGILYDLVSDITRIPEWSPETIDRRHSSDSFNDALA